MKLDRVIGKKDNSFTLENVFVLKDRCMNEGLKLEKHVDCTKIVPVFFSLETFLSLGETVGSNCRQKHKLTKISLI